MRDVAIALARRGFSVLPLYLPDHDDKNDGKAPKSPTIPWMALKTKAMTVERVANLFAEGVGLGLIMGAVSGNAEVIDFERPEDLADWLAFLKDNLGETDWLDELVMERTFRGGFHVMYRCTAVVIPGNTKLAQHAAPDDWPADGPKWHAGIETRGEGGYVMTWPTPGYEMVKGSFAELPDISAEQREDLLSAARFLDTLSATVDERGAAPAAPARPTGHATSTIDMYNDRADHRQILGRRGWTEIGKRTSGSRDLWRRPGKDRGQSATWDGHGFKVFSSASECAPLEMGRYYDKFDLYRLFEHGGDLKAALAQLRKGGFGKQPERVPPAADVDGPAARFADVPPEVGDVPEEHRGRAARPVAGKAAPFSHFPTPIKPDAGDVCDVPWLLYPWFVRGAFHDVHGDPGTGKTAFLEAIAAKISTGCDPGFFPWSPNGLAPGHVLLLATEDDYRSVTLKRLLRFGANLDNITIIDEAFAFDAAGLKYFEWLLSQRAYAFCMVDLLTRFIEMATKAARPDVSSQHIMAQMRRLADHSGTILTGTRHLRKNDREGAAIYAAHGGIEITGTSRSSIMLQEADEYQGPGVKRVNVAHVKTNYGEKGEPFAFEIKKVDRDTFDLLWVHGNDKAPSATDMMVSPTARREKGLLSQCKQSILDVLAGGQPIASKTLDEHMVGKGFSKATLQRAGQELTSEGLIKRWQKGGVWNVRRNYQTTLGADEYDPYDDE